MKNITVVGVGALGSHFVQFIRSEDVAMRIIDFDRVASKNTMSQFHPKTSVSRPKVLSMQGTMNLLWGTKLTTTPHKLTRDNATQLLSGADLIVDCLDNAEARRIIQDFVRIPSAIDLKIKVDPSFTAIGTSAFTPCLHGAVDADGSFGRVIWDEKFIIDSGSPPGTPTCEDGANLPFIVSVSAFMARAAQRFLREGQKVGFQVTPSGVIQTS